MYYLSGAGRIGRLRYFGTGVVLAFIGFIVLATVAAMTNGEGGGASLLAAPLFFVLIWASFASSIRRLHDLGMTGWLVLILFIPLVGSLFQFYLLFAPGDGGPNSYGPPFGGQPTLSLQEHRVQAAQIRADAAQAYAQRQG